jgi:hypothetical protein
MQIFYIEDNSQIVVCEVNHSSRLYAFSKLVVKLHYALILTHSNDDSIISHKLFSHLNFIYI